MTTLRIIFSLLFIILALVAGLFLWVVFAFSGLPYYAGMSVIAALALAAVTGVYLVNRISLRWLFSGVSMVAVACLLATAGYEWRQAYVNSIPLVHQREVDLSVYRPFSDSSKVAKLDYPATLKLENDLPVMDGATALYPVYAAFAEAVYPRGDYPPHTGYIRCSKTIDAYKALAEGEADVIFVADPSAEQLTYAKSQGTAFTFHPIGKEAFVFFTHKENNVDNLSIEQLKGIYSGEIGNWRTVGGPWSRIIAYQRPKGSGSQTALIRMMGDAELSEAPMDQTPAGMGGMVHTVATYRNYHRALGFTFRFYATDMVQNNRIRLLRVNGVYPDREAIEDGSYPLTAPFYAVTNRHPSANTEKLIAWIQSAQGQALIQKTGYTPYLAFD